MIHLFVIAGISLTATGISWWNGQRTKAVLAQIEALEDQFQRIHAADAQKRQAMLLSYAHDLERLVDLEIQTRNTVATELTASFSKARDVLARRLGSRESDAFHQVVLELELALSRIDAERAYLAVMKKTLENIAKGAEAAIPSPADLQLPNDFPREGGLVHFEGEAPIALHGYRLHVLDWSSELSGRAMLLGVDHRKRTAKVSVAGAALLEANLTDGGAAMPAKVIHRGPDGIHLNYFGAELILHSKGQSYSWLVPESSVDVYPEVWMLSQINQLGIQAPLPVRLHPRVGGSREFWSPILLCVSEDQLPLLISAYKKIDYASQSAPWRVHLVGSSQVAFSIGNVTLITTASSSESAFVLDEVRYGDVSPNVSVRFHAGLCAFVAGTNDDQNVDRSVFYKFVEALHAELSSQKQMLLQRQTALRLRKLSLIYQDQQEHIQSEGSCGFLPGDAREGGRVVIGTITAVSLPNWLDEALSTDGKTRLRAVGHSETWNIKRTAWVDRQNGICRLELETPYQANFQEINPFGLSRIERVGEGSQQQILTKSLENAILGKFVSSGVHSALLGLSGEPVQNTNLDRASVANLLDSDEPVVCIWGPPGTGKTTLLVKWLTSLFSDSDRSKWPSVLITAPTHVAVTKLVSDLLEQIDNLSDEIVRYGSAEKIKGTNLEPVWHENLLSVLRTNHVNEAQDERAVSKWKALLATREGRESAAKWLLGSKRIHAATCTGMARGDYGLWNRSFDIAIVDEAGKAFGAELLIPASVARKLILVGDHNQLPPTVTTEVLDESIGYRLSMTEVEDLLRRNTFHEIFEQLPVGGKGMLTKQFRMHKDIGDIVSKLFYENNLGSARNEDDWNLTTKRLVFVDFSQVKNYRHRKVEGTSSIDNATERAALHALLAKMEKTDGFRDREVLVVCPYEAQRKAVEQESERRDYRLNLDITTVDAVQGGEANIVILMMTRSSGRVQFLLDRHRLNVALSRARDAVVIFGHVECLTKDEDSPVSNLINIGKKRKSLNLIDLKNRADFKKDIADEVVK